MYVQVSIKYYKYIIILFRGHEAPVFIGFEHQDMTNITYGHIHIPSISLKEIPIHRSQLRLKLYYGTKKITTFNADLSNRHVCIHLKY